MKDRFTTLDIFATVHELQKYVGWRVQNVYDSDAKTYLIKLTRTDEKALLVLESGMRLHASEYNWPRPAHPSGFTMKLRKHLKQRHLDAVTQVGIDRIVDLQFGTGDKAYHLVIEMYDRGNLVLTDAQYKILNLLRWRTDKDADVRYAVGETYSCNTIHRDVVVLEKEELKQILSEANQQDSLRKVLAPKTLYGAPLLEHAAIECGLSVNAKISSLNLDNDLDKVHQLVTIAQGIYIQARDRPPKAGYIVYRTQKKAGGDETFDEYIDFQPLLLHQMEQKATLTPYKTFATFTAAVDEYFSQHESQKLESSASKQENAARKKLQNIEKDHEQRLAKLEKAQMNSARKAELIELNSDMVERALAFMRAAIAQGLDWKAIEVLVQRAKRSGQELGKRIVSIDLAHGAFTLSLDDPFAERDEEARSAECEIKIDMNAYQNARAHHDSRKWAAQKEQKTIDASEKALKSAKKKMEETVKEVHVKTEVQRQRKALWFEKFLWCITQDNYLVIAGRDAQQNELLVRRHLTTGDAYVHADIRGCASVIVKNHKSQEGADSIPARTLEAAGTMAVCYSPCWNAKVVTNVWWVEHDQVSRTAPAGEFLSTGSFMIRGKKRYLPPVQLVMGFGFLFRLADESIERRAKERCQLIDKQESEKNEKEQIEQKANNEEELQLSDDSADSDAEFPDVSALATELKNTEPTSSADDDLTIVQIGPQLTQMEMRQRARERKQAKARKKEPSKPQSSVQKQEVSLSKPKRGQKFKARKMKERYVHQDEEERELRMQIIQGAPKQREEGEEKEQNEDTLGAQLKHDEDAKEQQSDEEQRADEIDEEGEEEQQEEEETEVEKSTTDMQQLLNSLTGQPCADDVLLYAVPVCAPYAVMHDYKYKVKLTPGSGKRGKATKMAVHIFIKATDSTQRERDLLKAVSQQADIGRNVPGSVKVAAPQMRKMQMQQRQLKKE